MSGSQRSRIDGWARALGAVPSGLFIATAGTGAGATGFLASFVQQVGFEPPCLAIAVHAGRPVVELIREGGAFCISVLDEDSRALMAHFARGFEPHESAFDGVETAQAASGVPYLSRALAWLDCRVVGEVHWSDHIVFCGEVVGGSRREGGIPLVHVRKTGTSY
jgi:flavin reductase (DIM6/NTAB) family NADH-FMN oxidoreductase RutF